MGYVKNNLSFYFLSINCKPLKFTEEQALALAPDEASKKAGKDLANPNKWVSRGANESAMWGECQGSGSKPYQTQVDLGNIAFKCSCPSRKFPCKHGLGLLVLSARQPALFTSTEAPPWVTDWISKRTETAEKKEEKKDKPVDEAAQAKRLQAREQSVTKGIEELLLWMKDIVRNGILTIPEKDHAFFNNVVRRMVDAKAPGLANMVKTLANTNFYQDGWQTGFMDQLARMFLVISGYAQQNLPETLKEDVRNWIGFTQNQDELKEQPGISDIWMVLGKQLTEEDNLTTERTWFYGTQSGKYAMVLQFSVRGQGVLLSLAPGMQLQAELVFFPSAQPMRAIIKTQATSNTVITINGFKNWSQVAEAETNVNASLPFGPERPFIVHQVTPVFHASQWWLSDVEKSLVQLKDSWKNLYTLLSLSGGDPLDIAVIGRENVYEPIGAWAAGGYVSLTD